MDSDLDSDREDSTTSLLFCRITITADLISPPTPTRDENSTEVFQNISPLPTPHSRMDTPTTPSRIQGFTSAATDRLRRFLKPERDKKTKDTDGDDTQRVYSFTPEAMENLATFHDDLHE